MTPVSMARAWGTCSVGSNAWRFLYQAARLAELASRMVSRHFLCPTCQRSLQHRWFETTLAERIIRENGAIVLAWMFRRSCGMTPLRDREGSAALAVTLEGPPP